MDVRLSIEPQDQLVVRLREGDAETDVAVPQAGPGAESLTRALDDAIARGYGECFWPAVTGGHYWWMFRRDATMLEVVVMWSRGGASGWQHVFRATDAADWVRERLLHEIRTSGLFLRKT